jgi:cytoskeletal protein CcmA (bactofilin family)
VYDNALVLANNEHQLVFAGDSRVVGDVVAGISGVTTGTLRDVRTPRSIPVAGNILKTSSFQIPRIDELRIKTLLSSLEDELRSGSVGISGRVIDVGAIPDSTRSLKSRGELRIKGRITRRLVPLSIAAEGDVRVDSSAQFSGLISIISKGKITNEPGSILEHTLLYSREGIELQPGASATGQFIAPTVILNQGSAAAYPSVILNTKASADTKKLETVLHGGSGFEGTLIQLKDEDAKRSGSGIVIEKGARVLGSVYSENRLTLDGDVFGTVITHDFYFYEAPTQYYGWLRTGLVDRSKLPDGYLLPNIFQGLQTLRVLDWL